MRALQGLSGLCLSIIFLSVHGASSEKLHHNDAGHSLPNTRLDSIIELRRRGPATVDLSTIPECHGLASILSWNSCSQPSPGDLPGCNEVLVPCPAGSDATECYSYTVDCYCHLATPLACSWDCLSYRTWFLVEDWFAKTCPDVEPVDFHDLPSCSRSCIEQNSILAGCITFGRNCFCLQESLFNCPDSCTTEHETETIVDWYASECQIDPTAASTIVNGGQATRSAVAVYSKGRAALHWYEIVPTVVGVGSIVIFFIVVGLIWFYELRMKRSVQGDASQHLLGHFGAH